MPPPHYLRAGGARPRSGLAHDALVHPQPLRDVERVGPPGDAPQHAVRGRQLDLVKLHRGVLKLRVVVLQSFQLPCKASSPRPPPAQISVRSVPACASSWRVGEHTAEVAHVQRRRYGGPTQQSQTRQ